MHHTGTVKILRPISLEILHLLQLLDLLLKLILLTFFLALSASALLDALAMLASSCSVYASPSSINLNSASNDDGEAYTEQELANIARASKRAEAERGKKKRQEDKLQQQIQQLEEMKNAPFEAIQVTADGTDVHKIGTVLWSDVELKFRQEYMKHKNIKFGRNRSKDLLGPVIVQYLKAQPYRNAISNSRRTSSSSVTSRISSNTQRGNGTLVRKGAKPNFLVVDGDGTIFRAANVLLHHKECYVATKNALDRSELDSGRGHRIEWVTMTNTYNKTYDPDNVDTNIDCVQTYNGLEMFGIDPMTASEFDHPLTVEQFMQLVGFMEFHYNKACKECKKSGEHVDFLDKTNGVIWLGYLRFTFMSVGDKSLHEIVFSELPGDVLTESTDGAPGPRKGDGSRDWSVSPVPPGSHRKHASAYAIQGAASQLETRMTHLNRTENFDTLLKRTAERDDAEEEMERVKAELATMKTRRKAAKREGEVFAEEVEYKRLKKRRKTTNSKHIRLTEEVKRLEKLLGYDEKSYASSSSSSSGNDEA
eukprot:scaffold204_cov166-Alexandrium_tamarense.AAC.4